MHSLRPNLTTLANLATGDADQIKACVRAGMCIGIGVGIVAETVCRRDRGGDR